MGLADAWVARTSPADTDWRGVAWSHELGLFCAVSNNGSTSTTVMTSPNGINWTLRATPSGLTGFRSVIWVTELGLFIAASSMAGAGSRVMTSPDGINWTARYAPNGTWQNICWSPELNLLCVVGNPSSTQSVMTSSDGINWTIRTAPNSTWWYGVCWSSRLNLFVATAATNGAGYQVMTSQDGINWTLRVTPLNADWVNVTWSDDLGLLVAVNASAVAGARVMTSANGVNWTTRNNTPVGEFANVMWCIELSVFVAVARNGTSGAYAMVSTDGINWVSVTTAANNKWYGMAWSPDLSQFVAVSSSGTGNRVMTWSFGKIALTLTETIAAITFKAHAVTVGSNEVIGKASGQAPGFTLPTLDARPCHVTVAPDVGDRWYPSTVYALDQKVFPSNPVATPYYYKRLIAGTSGSTEPTWPTTPGGQCNDGAVSNAWELVERLVQPITHGPLIPS